MLVDMPEELKILRRNIERKLNKTTPVLEISSGENILAIVKHDDSEYVTMGHEDYGFYRYVFREGKWDYSIETPHDNLESIVRELDGWL